MNKEYAIGVATGAIGVMLIAYVALPKIARRAGIRAIGNQLNQLGIPFPASFQGTIGDKIEREVRKSVFV